MLAGDRVPFGGGWSAFSCDVDILAARMARRGRPSAVSNAVWSS